MKNLLLILLSIPMISRSQAPGAVSTNLRLWVKANAGITTTGPDVTGWTDQTAVNTFSVTGTPQLVTVGLNYNPSVLFNGSSRFSGATTITNTQAFAVGKIVNATGISGSGALIGNTAVGSGDYFFHTEGGRLYAGNPGIYTGYNTSNSLPYNLYSEDLSKTPAASDIIRINGANTVNHNGSDPLPFNRAPTLGSRAAENILNGSELAEAVIYDASQSTTNTAKIESYLAVKYGITLNNASGGTAGDYLSSAGTMVWDADNGSDYHHDVIGIARDDNSALTQKQSQSGDDSIRIYVGSLQATNSVNTGTFNSDAQFILIGHNTQPLNSVYGLSEYPSGQGIYSRIAREWKITNTNFDGTFSLDIKPKTSVVTASHLRVLVDDDGNFTNATMFNPTIGYSSGVITISGVSNAIIPANTTRYLTVVSLSAATPLPAGLINFTAVPIDNKYVQLNWQTVSETNNAYFAIERSSVSDTWKEITRINAAGNSTQLLSYTYTDNNPLKGICYYRLKQTDLDGQYTYSPVRSVDLEFTSDRLRIYPNPATDQLIVEGNANELRGLSVYDVAGRDLRGSIQTIILSDTKVEVITTKLPTGLYYIRTRTAHSKFFKQ